MIKAAIEKILEMGKIEREEIGGREYYFANGKAVGIIPPVQTSFQVETLTAISDYFVRNPDALPLGEIIVHVMSPVAVRLMSPVCLPWLNRHAYLEAQSSPKVFPFGRAMDVESFIVALQTYFVPSETTRQLQQMVSSLSDQTSVDYTDDGIGQQVTAKTGIARVGKVEVPNPVHLAPYRSFREIEQPASAFVFRIQKNEKGPLCVLHEADGGNWQREAVESIRDWLKDELPEGVVILA